MTMNIICWSSLWIL